MVQTQFQTSVKILRTDNGTEFFNTCLNSFLSQHGIIHQSSCVNTPQQNGVAERKNRHLLEVARALMFTMHVPKYLWGDAVLTAAYLINRLPSRPLNFETPYSILQKTYPHFLSTNLPAKTFGCTAFVHLHATTRSKLDPRACKTIFIGYSATQKGYRCYCPRTKKLFISRDVTFFENTPFFSPVSLQGEKENEVQQCSWNLEIPIDSTISPPSLESTQTPTDSLHNQSSMEESVQEIHPNSDHNLDQDNKVHLRREIQHVYTRQRKNIIMNSHHNQESNPMVDPSSPGKSGNHVIDLENNLDIPIALGKGTRTCTQHPISKSISYSNLSNAFKAFTTNLSDVIIPRNIEEAMSIPEWKAAVHEEIEALEKNGTWKLMNLPSGKRAVGCKWVFTIKYNENGVIQRYKARLVAKGFTQTYGIDFSETFAPVAKLNTIRILLSLATNLDWELHQLDVKNAFLNGELEEEVYMMQPPGFEKVPNHVCKLNKSLYGLKQSPRAWFNRFSNGVKNMGYTQSQADHTLFINHSKEGKITILIVYVDDIIVTGDNLQEIRRIKELLAKEFEIKDLGMLKYFLGMEIARSKQGISVSQRKYTLDLLKETGMLGCKASKTPIELGNKEKMFEGAPVDKTMYQQLVGKLIYLSHTRPDIAFAVSLVSQYMHQPCQGHLDAVYRILKYLKQSPGKGLFFKKTSDKTIKVFTDADWAGAVDDRKSTSGYCTLIWGNLVTWRSKKQNVVARSSAEAEYRSMAHGVCEAVWIKRICDELKLLYEGPIQLYCDNQSAIRIAHNPVQHDRTKHVEVDRHFIKEKIDGKIIKIEHVHTGQQLADILTKGLQEKTFDFLLDKLGLINIYRPA